MGFMLRSNKQREGRTDDGSRFNAMIMGSIIHGIVSDMGRQPWALWIARLQATKLAATCNPADPCFLDCWPGYHVISKDSKETPDEVEA